MQRTESVAEKVQRLSLQRDQWQTYLCTELAGVVERVLRDLYAAADQAAAKRVRGSAATRAPTTAKLFRAMLERIKSWSDTELMDEFGETRADSPEKKKAKAGRVEEYLKTVVWAQATLMSISCGKPCKEVIVVPNVATFLRAIVENVGLTQEPAVFGAADVRARTELRTWICDTIKRHVLSLVPVSVFAVYAGAPYAPPPQPAQWAAPPLPPPQQQLPPSSVVSCANGECSVTPFKGDTPQAVKMTTDKPAAAAPPAEEADDEDIEV